MIVSLMRLFRPRLVLLNGIAALGAVSCFRPVRTRRCWSRSTAGSFCWLRPVLH